MLWQPEETNTVGESQKGGWRREGGSSCTSDVGERVRYPLPMLLENPALLTWLCYPAWPLKLLNTESVASKNTFIVLQFWESKICKGSHWAKIKVSEGLHCSLEGLGEKKSFS